MIPPAPAPAPPSASSIARAQQWSSWDPNPTTKNYVQDLLQKCSTTTTTDAAKELVALFPADDDDHQEQRIGFGTAGLRSAMKPGPLHMNDLVVLQTAQGLVRYCQSHLDTQTKRRMIVGYDHRSKDDFKLSSRSFAVMSALVFQQAGYECILLDGLVHTPLVAFATSYYDCAAGIMVTASHNPAQDDGYKVYWCEGCQIRPPLDSGISKSILENLQPWTDYSVLLQKLHTEHPNDACLGLSSVERTEQVKAAYYEAIRQSGLMTNQARLLSPDDDKSPRFVYTAMHGVGLEPARRIFQEFGLPPFRSVESQEQPDPTFPTVSFPNPEEKGALDLAEEYAQQCDCDVVLANDPDADRLAVAERNRETNEWTVFTGDQIGTMLGHWLWESVGKKNDDSKPVAMCASTVSSKMLAEIARVEGFHFEDTLTGFKWIGSRLKQMSSDYKSLFGYEEAIGFCCGDVVFDKDGITAMAVFAELAIHVYRQQQQTLAQHMQSLYNRYGEFVSNNGYFLCYDPRTVQKIMKDMRGPDNKYMESVGDYRVAGIRDLGVPGYDSSTQDKKPTLPTSHSSPMISITFENGCVAQFRASGTEPKLKYYIELKGKPGVSRAEVEKDLHVMSEVLLADLLKPEENGLVKPHTYHFVLLSLLFTCSSSS